ncbi:MAG: SRPBCC family protein [Planctomyces sp.]|nr:SRPBCC family protein [Planctomyces sp.]
MTVSETFKLSLPDDTHIVVSREFDAPRDLVWQAMTSSDLIRRWVAGPPGWEMTICEDDRRVGGEFHWAWTGPDGMQLAMRGVNREIVPPQRGSRTERFEMVGGPPMGEQLATLVLVEQGGRTHMTITLEYDSKAARDGAAASGMEHGMSANYARLDELLAQAGSGSK